MPDTVFIYALNDLTTGRTRYIGKALDSEKRLRWHLTPSRLKGHTHKNCWIRSLAVPPVLEVLDEVPFSQADFWEREYIRLYRGLFSDLTNTTDGGEGGATTRGRKASVEEGARRSMTTRGCLSPRYGKTNSPEWCAKHSADMLGTKNPNFGKRRTPEQNARQSAAMTGRKYSGERLAQMKVTFAGENNPMFGRKHSLETKEKIRLKALGRRREGNF